MQVIENKIKPRNQIKYVINKFYFMTEITKTRKSLFQCCGNREANESEKVLDMEPKLANPQVKYYVANKLFDAQPQSQKRPSSVSHNRTETKIHPKPIVRFTYLPPNSILQNHQIVSHDINKMVIDKQKLQTPKKTNLIVQNQSTGIKLGQQSDLKNQRSKTIEKMSIHKQVTVISKKNSHDRFNELQRLIQKHDEQLSKLKVLILNSKQELTVRPSIVKRQQ